MTRLERIRTNPEVKLLRLEHENLIHAGRYLEAHVFCTERLIPAEYKA